MAARKFVKCLLWARNGRELFYQDGDKMMATAVETKPVFAAAKPEVLIEGHCETGVFPFERRTSARTGRAS